MFAERREPTLLAPNWRISFSLEKFHLARGQYPNLRMRLVPGANRPARATRVGWW